jgi:hypothetical protein
MSFATGLTNALAILPAGANKTAISNAIQTCQTSLLAVPDYADLSNPAQEVINSKLLDVVRYTIAPAFRGAAFPA